MMEPGRKLDALIAKHVMGYAFKTLQASDYGCGHCGRPILWSNRPCNCHYSTDDDAAWGVVKKMVSKGFDVGIYRDAFDDADPSGWLVNFWAVANEYRGVGGGATLAFAVCIAALRALDVLED
jgi:hypothetical protein